MMKKLLTVMLALICVMLFAVPAMAEDISSGNITITTGGDYIISGASDNKYTIIVKSGVTANVTLSGVNISNDSVAPFYIEKDATVNLTLAAGTTNTLVAEGAQLAGLHVADGATLNILGDDTGVLNATGGKNAPGIGGVGSGCTVKKIAISGGIVNAYGTNNGSGIGAATYADINEITISGGMVTAIAGNGGKGAGIGLGVSESGGTDLVIAVSGGTINATGGGHGNSADIGGYGWGENEADVIITGGNIKTANGIRHCTLTNGTEDVVKHTFTFDGIAADSEIESLTGVTYNLNDVKPLDGELYAYLPANAVPTAAKAGGTDYPCYKDGTFYATHGELNPATCTQLASCQRCGSEVGTYAAHTPTYSLSTVNTEGDTIKAVCSKTDCNADLGSVTISAEDTVYTGDKIEATVTNTLTTGATISEVKYTAEQGSLTDSKPQNVGEYSASISVGGKTATVSYAITNAPTPTIVSTSSTDMTVKVGEKATFKVVATNVDHYEWYKWNDRTQPPVFLGDDSIFEIDAVSLENDGDKYICVVFGLGPDNYKQVDFTLHVTNPGAPAPTSAPQTGDASNIGLWLALSCISLAGMVAIVMQGKKKRI